MKHVKKNQQKVKNELRKKKFKKMKNKIDDVFDCAILLFNGCNICNIVPVKKNREENKKKIFFVQLQKSSQ